MATWVRAHARTGANGPGPSGGMADTTDSKSVARKGVRVQIPPRAPTDLRVREATTRSRVTVATPWQRDSRNGAQACQSRPLIAHVLVRVLLQRERHRRMTPAFRHDIGPDSCGAASIATNYSFE